MQLALTPPQSVCQLCANYLGADAHHRAYCNYSIIFATFGHCFCQDGELKASWNPGYLLHSTQILQSDLNGGQIYMVYSVRMEDCAL